MMTSAAGTVLENAIVVEHDRASARPLGFAHGRVSTVAAGAFRLDLREHLVFPGLINAHDHLQLNCIPPLPHAELFANSYAWIDAFEAHRQSPLVSAAVAVPSAVRHWHGGLKNLLAGVTTVAHHDPWQASFEAADFPVGVVRDFGWSHSLGLGLPRSNKPPKYGPAVFQSFCATPSTHPWMIHLAEGTDDVARAELARLDELGCLAANTVLIHGVGMTSPDVQRVIDRDAAVVWCPASNLNMLGCSLDPHRLAEAHRLTLGTDSRLTGSRDLLDELRVAAGFGAWSSRELMGLVTTDARSVLRLPGCGGLGVGQQADCLIVRAGSNPYDTLIETRREAIRAVVRGGVPLIADPDFGGWFAHCGVPTVRVRLDGRPKLMAVQLAWPEALALEPGLEIGGGSDA
ncbi:MAG: amidohydrolase [bacterium]